MDQKQPEFGSHQDATGLKGVTIWGTQTVPVCFSIFTLIPIALQLCVYLYMLPPMTEGG